jgi:hypothetical protein
MSKAKDNLKALIIFAIIGVVGGLLAVWLFPSEKETTVTVCECYDLSNPNQEIRIDNDGRAYYSWGFMKDGFMSQANKALQIGTADAIEKVEKLEKKWNDLCESKMFPDELSKQIRVREELAKCN